MTSLSPEAIAAGDPSRLLDDVLAMGEHLRDGLWRVESAGLALPDAPGGLVVAGMGGSAIGGALAAAALGPRAARPIVVSRSYVLPPWTTRDTCVLCSSYSGDTEETVAAYAAAGRLGAARVVATTGGRLAAAARADGVPVIPLPAALQPRAAVGYLTAAALEVAAACGAGPSLGSEIEAAADLLDSLSAGWGPEGPEDGLARELARDLYGTLPVIVGAGLTIPVAYRWKTQLNENAKVPAAAGELPELDHNEIQGWAGADGLARLSAVFLDDVDSHPRDRERIALTSELAPQPAFAVSSRGATRTERLFSLVLLGDLVSVYAAVLRGVDPTPVEALTRLKQRLAQTLTQS